MKDYGGRGIMCINLNGKSEPGHSIPYKIACVASKDAVCLKASWIHSYPQCAL